MAFVKLEAGAFVMGSPPAEIGREAQESQRSVTLTRPYWLGVFEVTQHEWREVMGDNPSHFQGGDRLPVENVTWFDVHTFLERLTRRSPGNRFRLPTEAEWEYACRAGTVTAYGMGSTLNPSQANVAESVERTAAGDGQTRAVGSFAPNAWGLHDMHGNVWEWTEDDYCPYTVGSAVDPNPRCGAPLKVIRGGSWYFAADSARCALRYTHRPGDMGFSLGFRVVREPERSENDAD
ncbi:MAG: formylglycine-generating enzyme family protein [Vicinamibacterales bacterium]